MSESVAQLKHEVSFNTTDAHTCAIKADYAVGCRAPSDRWWLQVRLQAWSHGMQFLSMVCLLPDMLTLR
jgi:hypothetical protein